MADQIQSFIENLSARFRESQLGSFVNWWFAELTEMLPAGLKQRMQHARRRVLIHIVGDELSLSVSDAESLQEIEVMSFQPDSRILRQQLEDLLEERELAEVPRDLLLEESRILRKQVVLPLAAETNLRQALSFEMDRQTPFRADDVFFDYRVLQRERDSTQLTIELLVTLKAPVMRDIESLTPLGMAPTGVDVKLEGQPAGMNLLPPALRFKMVNRKLRLNLGLAALTVVSVIVFMVQSTWLRQQQISNVQAAIESVRLEARQVQEIKDQIKDASEAAGFMMAVRSAALPTVKIFAEVTEVLPDDTYLDRLLIGNESVQLQGKSQNAQQLIELVNQSRYFKDASFRGPTRLDSRTQSEIFDLSANLDMAGQDETGDTASGGG